MKKLIALLLTLALVFSLAACGGGGGETPSGSNDDPPTSGQQQEQNTPGPDEGEDEPEETPDDGSEDAPAANEWPAADFITDAMTYTGAGNIVAVYSWDKGGTYQVIYDSASVDEVAAYVAGLKNAGFVFQSKIHNSEEKEPGDFEKMFYVSVYEWQGANNEGKYVSIKHSDEPSAEEFRDSHGETAQLIITLYATDPELP